MEESSSEELDIDMDDIEMVTSFFISWIDIKIDIKFLNRWISSCFLVVSLYT